MGLKILLQKAGEAGSQCVLSLALAGTGDAAGSPIAPLGHIPLCRELLALGASLVFVRAFLPKPAQPRTWLRAGSC